ncbi:MAG: hypothetical protein LC721_12345, partial [Actinobacteria bacterium]|nr:hypothetical protein [Actinomycetota bacterium]
CKFGHSLDLHVAALEQPLVILFEQHRADEAGDASLTYSRRLRDSRRSATSNTPRTSQGGVCFAAGLVL